MVLLLGVHVAFGGDTAVIVTMVAELCHGAGTALQDLCPS